MTGCRWLALMLVACGPAVASAGQDEKADPEKAFATLWEAALKDPEKADFGKVRAAYVETKGYRPYAFDRDREKGVRKAIGAGDLAGAKAQVEAILRDHPLDIDANQLAAFVASKAKDKEAETRYLAIHMGQLRSILEGRDGKTYDTAYPVIDVREEYAVLRALGLEHKAQALHGDKGHHYDVMTAIDPESKQERDVHFNIDLPFVAMSKAFKIKDFKVPKDDDKDKDKDKAKDDPK